MAHKVDLSWAARNRSKGENVVRAGGRDFDRAFHMLLTFDFAEIEFPFHRTLRRTNR